MNDNKRNVRKLQILTILNYATTPLSAKKIHEQCNSTITLTTIRTRLLDYVRQHIIKRIKVNKKYKYPYEYQITQKGVNRLNYSLNIKDQIDLLVREPLLIREKIKKLVRDPDFIDKEKRLKKIEQLKFI